MISAMNMILVVTGAIFLIGLLFSWINYIAKAPAREAKKNKELAQILVTNLAKLNQCDVVRAMIDRGGTGIIEVDGDFNEATQDALREAGFTKGSDGMWSIRLVGGKS